MDLKVDLTAIGTTAIVFFSSAIIVATVFYFIHRAKEMRHQTIRLALEKGQPLPPGLLQDPPRVKPRANDLNSGVKALFIGIGVSLFFWFFHQRLWPLGFIPGFVGLGYIAAWALTGRQQPDAPTAG